MYKKATSLFKRRDHSEHKLAQLCLYEKTILEAIENK